MKDNQAESGEIMSCTFAEQAVACAEVILEIHAFVRRKKVEEAKVFVRRMAKQSGNDLLVTAVCLMPPVALNLADGWREGPPPT